MILNIGKEIKNTFRNLDPSSTYIVGGFVRDKLMHRKPKDIDIVSSLSVEEISKRLKLSPYIVNDRFNTARFYAKSIFIDYNAVDDLNLDLKRRDFTINSIACDLNGNIHDPLNGISDINKGIIRLSSCNSLNDDPLRILRAFRLKHQLNFKFSRGLLTLARKSAKQIESVPKERIYVELKELLSKNNRGKVFRELHASSILLRLFPQLLPAESFIHVKHKSRYLLGHLLNTAECVDEVLSLKLPREFSEYANKYIFEIYLSALLHDTFKPECFTIEKNKQRFFNHDIIASVRMGKILKETIKASNEEAARVALLIKLHMRPHFLLNQNATDRGVYRLFRDAGGDASGLLILCMADILSSEGRVETGYVRLFKRMKRIEKKISSKQVRLLNGDEIMAHFKLQQGKIIGEMLDSGNSWAVENSVSDKKIILRYLKEKFSL
ncbi:MAG: hypothetical protein PHW02_07815 [bacterium]|nr:hypothetical protein [bacterium]